MDSEQGVSPVDNSDKWSDAILQASAYTPTSTTQRLPPRSPHDGRGHVWVGFHRAHKELELAARVKITVFK